MSVLRRTAAAVIAALAVLLCTSQAAAAVNAQGVPSKGALVELSFKNRDGYKIRVAGFGQTVALSVIRHLAEGSSSTTYFAHGTVTPTSIRASFADRGRIAVRFRPTGAKIRHPGRYRCGPRDDGVIGRHGVFVGGLRFSGEAGYTSASVHRAPGQSVDYRALVACLLSGGFSSKRQAAQAAERLPAGFPGVGLAVPGVLGRMPSGLEVPTHPTPGPKPTMLSADDKLPLSRTVFFAVARGSGRSLFLAEQESSDGSLGIVRYVSVTGPPQTFAFDDALSLGGVTPPSPFSGAATFQHGAAGAKSWAGSLAVSFLGATDFPLTGSGFRSSLTRGW
jgi:hypothetical protein